MSAQPTIEDVAHETACRLMTDAIQFVREIVERHSYLDTPTEAILIATHARIAKLDSMETSLINALNALRECMSYLVARSDIGGAGDVPTAHERGVMYRALEADYLAKNVPANIREMDAALCRLKLLAGL